ncbi:MAG: RNA polymerase sigma factor [Balneolaceae bacterium]|nr:RNA polymerase sigma factor [Balneolaceae bacterium]
MSDAEIWNKLKNGDRKALKYLFECYYNDLYAYAYKISGDSFLANDCVQELYFRIWDRRKHLTDIQSIKAYLWVSLRRDIFKAIRRESKEIVVDDVISYSKLLTFTKEDLMIHKEDRREQKEALLEALNKLPDRHREAIYLKYFDGMGYGEIQQIMSVSYQTARNYIYHGVKALKNEFEGRLFTSSVKTAI